MAEARMNWHTGVPVEDGVYVLRSENRIFNPVQRVFMDLGYEYAMVMIDSDIVYRYDWFDASTEIDFDWSVIDAWARVE